MIKFFYCSRVCGGPTGSQPPGPEEDSDAHVLWAKTCGSMRKPVQSFFRFMRSVSSFLMGRKGKPSLNTYPVFLNTPTATSMAKFDFVQFFYFMYDQIPAKLKTFPSASAYFVVGLMLVCRCLAQCTTVLKYNLTEPLAQP